MQLRMSGFKKSGLGMNNLRKSGLKESGFKKNSLERFNSILHCNRRLQHCVNNSEGLPAYFIKKFSIIIKI